MIDHSPELSSSNVRVGCAFATPTGRLRWTDHAFGRMVGHPRGTLPGRSLADWLSPDARALLRRRELEHPAKALALDCRLPGGAPAKLHLQRSLLHEPSSGTLLDQVMLVTRRAAAAPTSAPVFRIAPVDVARVAHGAATKWNGEGSAPRVHVEPVGRGAFAWSDDTRTGDALEHLFAHAGNLHVREVLVAVRPRPLHVEIAMVTGRPDDGLSATTRASPPFALHAACALIRGQGGDLWSDGHDGEPLRFALPACAAHAP